MRNARSRHACASLLAVCSAWLSSSNSSFAAGADEGANAVDDSAIATAAILAEESHWRQILAFDPGDEDAYRALVRISESRALPVSSSAARAAQRRLPDSFRPIQTERFVILTDVDEETVLRHGGWLERAHDEFLRFARACGMRPLPLEHKLVCVLFQSDESYRAFARANDGMSDRLITGYYSPRNDRVVFALEQEAPPSPTLPIAEAPGPELKTVLRFDAGHADELNHNCTGNDTAAKCVHETIHQLMFHTRLMNRDVQYPLWICEGLSTAFETLAPGHAFGPDCDYPPRRVSFQDLLAHGELLPLRELVVLARLPGGDERAGRAIYPQSYALVTWLCHSRPAELRRYLDVMRVEPAGRLSEARHLQLFEEAFGAPAALEQAWLVDEHAAMSAPARRDVP